MNLFEIVNRKPDSMGRTFFGVEEKQYVVEEYIKERKGVSVNIRRIPNNYNPLLVRELQLLDQAFYCAQKYFLTEKNENIPS